MDFPTMHPDDLAKHWRSDGPLIDDLTVRCVKGEVWFRIGDCRLILFKRCGAWRWKRHDGSSDQLRRVWRKSKRETSYPLGSMAELDRLVRGLAVEDAEVA